MSVIWEFKITDPESKEQRKLSVEKNPVLVGRGRESDLKLPYTQVSKKHARLEFADSRIFVEDLESSNGTFIYRKGDWKKVEKTIRARGPIMLNFGKAVNVVVKAQMIEPVLEHAPDEIAEAIKGVDLERFSGRNIDSSFVESIDEVETREAILVLDLCSSSEMAATDEKMAFHTKRKLKDICERAFAVHSARFVKGTGDGFLATFLNPFSAFQSARRIMDDLRQRNERTANLPIHVRMALHHGSTYTIDQENKDIHGNDVNITFRMEGLTADAFTSAPSIELPATDRLLCSAEFRLAMVNGKYPMEKASFEPMGMAGLKGIKEEKVIYLIEFQEK